MSKQAIQLSDHFTVSRLLRFVVPCIGTVGFMLGTGGSAIVAITLSEGDKKGQTAISACF